MIFSLVLLLPISIISLVLLLPCLLARPYVLVISEQIISPDGIKIRTIVANNSLPGPTIEIFEHEELDLTIVNECRDQGITIHLHGITQKGTPQFDGASFISQNLIEPNSSFNIRISPPPPAGTFYYHAHHALFDRSVYGALIVRNTLHSPFNQIQDSRVIMLSDWWNQDPQIQLQGLLDSKFKWIGMPDSLLVNGLSKGTVIHVQAGQTYRFRIIAATSLVYLALAFESHADLQIIEVDGNEIYPVSSEYLEINAGQRYSVQIRITDTPGDYLISGKVMWRSSNVTAAAILRVHNPRPLARRQRHRSNASFPHYNTESPGWMAGQFRAKNVEFDASIRPSRSLTLVGKQEILANQTAMRWTVNGIPFTMPSMKRSLLQIMVEEGTFESLPLESQPITLFLDETIEIILQNTAALNGICEEHPWHLHGHQFWIMASGPGQYTPHQNVTYYKKPTLRDTTTLFPYSGSYFESRLAPHEPCGWQILHFKADNAGIWLFHCHITAHMVMGMSIVFLVK